MLEPDRKPNRPELVMSRTFQVPRQIVFEAWTNADHLSQWFTPSPLTTSECQVDFRPGGVFRLVMRTPDGVEYPFDGKFGEIMAPERLAFSGRIHGGNDVETTVTFVEADGVTTLTVRQTYGFESDATRGAPHGWGLTLDQLGRHVEKK